MSPKQKKILDFMKEQKPKSEVIIPNECKIQDVFIKAGETDLNLYVKERGMNRLISKITKEQLLKIQGLKMNLSPQKLHKILPEVDEKNLLLICEALISLLRNKRESIRTFI
ncbi:MAG: hypothetical protein ACTSSI_14455 [Candidatus Helarchaeota archaeon]